jgi:hypothetical protein
MRLRLATPTTRAMTSRMGRPSMARLSSAKSSNPSVRTSAVAWFRYPT